MWTIKTDLLWLFLPQYLFFSHFYIILYLLAVRVRKCVKSLSHAGKLVYPFISLWLLPLSRFSHVQLCDPIDGSPPGSPVPGIFQARTVKWVAISFSNAWKWKVKVKSLSRVRLFEIPWTVAHQAPPSMGFSRQEYWSGVPSPSPIKKMSDTCNLFSPFGDPWPSCLLPSHSPAPQFESIIS